jgi:hypothetical protein
MYKQEKIFIATNYLVDKFYEFSEILSKNKIYSEVKGYWFNPNGTVEVTFTITMGKEAAEQLYKKSKRREEFEWVE